MTEQNMSQAMTQVEESIRSQRDVWATVIERITKIPNGELPIEQPKRILFFGVGSSYFAARLCSYAVIRDKTRARIPVVACNSMVLGTEVHPQKGDWAFGFSHRGGTRATNQALELCAQVGAFTILVAGEGHKPVEAAKHVLLTSPQEVVEPHTMSVTGAICAVTTLLLGQRASEEWDALRSLPAPNLESLRAKVGMGPTILLGEWEGEWLAKEGALKMMEMAKLPVRSYGTEEYFHGPKFCQTDKDVIWHIALAKDPRTSEFQPAQRVSVFASSPLAFVPALLELQWMALAVSLNRGVDPDTV